MYFQRQYINIVLGYIGPCMYGVNIKMQERMAMNTFNFIHALSTNLFVTIFHNPCNNVNVDYFRKLERHEPELFSDFYMTPPYTI